MDNQHKQIKGYRDLDQSEVDLMNDLKILEEQILDVLAYEVAQGTDLDPRWLAIGKSNLETAFMYLVKAVAKPESPYRTN